MILTSLRDFPRSAMTRDTDAQRLWKRLTRDPSDELSFVSLRLAYEKGDFREWQTRWLATGDEKPKAEAYRFTAYDTKTRKALRVQILCGGWIEYQGPRYWRTEEGRDDYLRRMLDRLAFDGRSAVLFDEQPA